MTTSQISPIVGSYRIREGTAPIVRARIVDGDGVPLLKNAISSISYSVFTITSGLNQPVLKAGPSPLTVADVWFDTLSTVGWRADTTGWNFKATLPASVFIGLASAIRGQEYQVEIYVTPTSGEGLWGAFFNIEVIDALSKGT